MAACSLGASDIKLSKLDFGRERLSNLQQQTAARVWMNRRQLQFANVTLSNKSKKAFNVCYASSLETKSKETRSSGSTSQLIPNSAEIESLVTEICNTGSIAEFELKLDGFRLHVKRNLAKNATRPPPPLPAAAPSFAAPVSVNKTKEASESNGSASESNESASTTSLAISKPVPPSGGIQSFLGRAADEGLMLLQSPRVGFFRRSRTIKGKRAPPSCKEKQIVKEGQVLCYIEQLGGELPIESDVSGEVIKILREDGEPVGYGDALVAILPSFPGIKKLQ